MEGALSYFALVTLASALGPVVVCWLGWMIARRWTPESVRSRLTPFSVVSVLLVLSLVIFPAGCMWALRPVQQPASAQTVAAMEVPLGTAADRVDLLTMLRRHARQGGLHVDDNSARWLEFRRNAPADEPPFAKNVLTKTIYVGLWRGVEDDDPEVMVDDGGHLGRPWLTFLRGKHPELATRTRVGLMAEIRGRWPEARDVPVMANGGLPLESDLVRTGTTYVVKPERLGNYAPRSPRAPSTP